MYTFPLVPVTLSRDAALSFVPGCCVHHPSAAPPTDTPWGLCHPGEDPLLEPPASFSVDGTLNPPSLERAWLGLAGPSGCHT